jgi:predicted ATPase
LLRLELDEYERTGWTAWHPEFLGILAEGLAGLEDFRVALALVERALAKADQGGERYYVPELLRLRGEFLLAQAVGTRIAEIDDCFFAAVTTARHQGALLLEFRAALSLARWRIRQHRPEDARQILAPVYARFTEGFGAVDLRVAEGLLVTLDSR